MCSIQVLKRPAAGVIGSVSAGMGFQDVSKHQEEDLLKARPSKKQKRMSSVSAVGNFQWQEQVRLCAIL